MRAWIITVGEPLPTDGTDVRLYRSGILAYLMAEQGHEVTWWSSSFDHVAKKHRVQEQTDISLNDRLTLSLLKGPGYPRNISLRRNIDHMIVARGFRKSSRERDKPDIILVSYPTIELSLEAVRFGRQFNVPVVVDVRDLWPDIFELALPGLLRPIAHLLLLPMNRQAREVFRSATAVTGITDEIRDWGLDKVARKHSAIDRSFPFGYDASAADSANKPQALEFWREMGVSVDDWNICFFGTLGSQFDLATVIGAARELANRDRQVRFIICGDGDLKAEFENMAGDLPNILFPGWVDRVQIRALMEISRIGLAPYYPTQDFLMSLPNKAIEYMSAGLPILSTIGGVLGRLISEQEIGKVCDQPDPRSLAEQIASLVDDPDGVTRMGKSSLELFERRFDANLVYSQFSEYLQQIARQGDATR